MCQPEPAAASAKDQVNPWVMVAWRVGVIHDSETWHCEFFTDNDKQRGIDAARTFAEGIAQKYSEVRVMTAAMVAKWGPTDPGGVFNRDRRLAGRDGVIDAE